MWYWKIYGKREKENLILLKTYIESKEEAQEQARSFEFHFHYKTKIKRFSEK